MDSRDKQRLAEIYRNQKILKQEVFSIIGKYPNKERASKVYDMIVDLHGHIYECSYDESETLLDMIERFYNGDEESLEFFESNKHKAFYKSAQVYEQYADNDVQKKLKRSGKLNKSKMKKCNTANQHLNTVYESKRSYDKELLAADNERRLRVLELKMAQVEEDLNATLKSKKQAAYKMYTDNKKLTYQDLGVIFDVSDSTIKRWLREVREGQIGSE